MNAATLAATLAALLAAVLLSLALAVLLALTRFPGRRLLVGLLHAAVAVPPMLAGGALAARLGHPHWRLPAASLLCLPLVAAIARHALARGWARHGRDLRAAGAGSLQAALLLCAEHRAGLAAALLAGLARALGEAGFLTGPAWLAAPAALLAAGAAWLWRRDASPPDDTTM
ncbi:MAG: hypothetical protein KGL55_04290 [Rhodospirillales bacterium]|nr:hypothetical protein [Rhodospirillales bacterium]